MARIDEGQFSENQVRLIESAERRAHLVTNLTISELRKLQQGTSTSIWNEVERCFCVSRRDLRIPQKLTTIIQTYISADRIVASNQCVITLMTAELDSGTGWGHSILDSGQRMSGFDYEIQVGTAFLSGSSADYTNYVYSCSRPNDSGLLRATTLLHEAIHFYNGLGGHSSLAPLQDPYNYEFFIFSIFCVLTPRYIENYRRYPIS